MPQKYLRMSAVISPCGLYRFRLERVWDDSKPTCGLFMLNPSRADWEQDDPTIRRGVGFSKREGCGALVVGNLYNFRATKPVELLRADDPLGPDADMYLREALAVIDGPVIAGWGAHPMAVRRAAEVAKILGPRAMCLGKTKDGHPRHPLYVRADKELEPLAA